MNSDQMKKAYRTPKHLEARLKDTLAGLPEKSPKQSFKKRVPAIALACLLVVTAAAIADSQWGILDYLRSMGEPTGDTRGLDERVEQVSQTQTGYNTEVTITDALFKKRVPAIALEYKNQTPDQPVYVIVTRFTADGEPITLETENDTPDYIWLPGIYYPEGHTRNALFGTPKTTPQNQNIAVSLTVSLFKPLRPVVNLSLEEGEQGDSPRYQAAIQQAYEEGNLSLTGGDHINLPEQETRRLAQENGGISLDMPETLTALGLMERRDLRFDFTLKNR